MNDREAIKKIEKLIDCGKPRPKLNKRESERSESLEASDFNKPEDFQTFSEDENEIEVTVTGYAIRARPGNHFEPPEGGYSEDVVVWLGNEDITDLIKEKVYERLCEKHYCGATEQWEEDYAEAMERKRESQEDR